MPGLKIRNPIDILQSNINRGEQDTESAKAGEQRREEGGKFGSHKHTTTSTGSRASDDDERNTHAPTKPRKASTHIRVQGNSVKRQTESGTHRQKELHPN